MSVERILEFLRDLNSFAEAHDLEELKARACELRQLAEREIRQGPKVASTQVSTCKS